VEAHSKIFLDDWLICDLEYVKHCSLGFDLKILFKTLKEAQILIERWRREYNTVRPHSALGYRPPAPEAIQVMPRDPGSAMLRQDLWADLVVCSPKTGPFKMREFC